MWCTASLAEHRLWLGMHCSFLDDRDHDSNTQSTDRCVRDRSGKYWHHPSKGEDVPAWLDIDQKRMVFRPLHSVLRLISSSYYVTSETMDSIHQRFSLWRDLVESSERNDHPLSHETWGEVSHICLSSFPYCEHGEHGLSDVECVSPIVIDHGPIVLLDTEHVTTEGLVWNTKSFQEIQFSKHSNAAQNGFIVRENHVVEFPGVQTKLIRVWKWYMNDTLNVVIGCNDMVG